MPTRSMGYTHSLLPNAIEEGKAVYKSDWIDGDNEALDWDDMDELVAVMNLSKNDSKSGGALPTVSPTVSSTLNPTINPITTRNNIDLANHRTRFLKYVTKQPGSLPDSDCWIWTGGRDKDGYGKFRMGNKTRKAHRVAIELFTSQTLTPDLQPDHLCETPSCVNPDHLELVDHKTNTLRNNGPSAINARKTHCPKGHEYTEANTYITPKGWRRCRLCRRISR